jgi:exodeoxyribonuclease V gamma subunit
MFALHTSNRAENLLHHLAQVIEAQPLHSPFKKEILLIQSQGMERWISQQLAGHFGLWGNYQFYFPGNFFAEMSGRFVARESGSGYQREQMVWIFEQLLRDVAQGDSELFQIVSDYLSSGSRALKRFQLAGQLAKIFDQYQMMRPDWLKDWSRGKLLGLGNAEPWQSALWQQINRHFGHCHRGELWAQTIAAIDAATPEMLAEQLPQRISIFGLNTIPPLLLRMLKGLAQHIDIHLYLLTPTRDYWGDSGSVRSNIRHALESESFENDHRLLQSLGEQAREFQRVLLEGVEFSHEFSSYEESEGQPLSTLQRLQNELLNNCSQREAVARDHSISIHSCHSALREVEVIHDQLLALLDEDSTLELRDIVVMSPDIQNYAPHIRVLFGDIPHAIADRTLRDEGEVLDNMIQFLKLVRGRFGWQEVLDLLERAAIYPAFGLHEDDLQLIRHWISEVNIRWGLSADHRQELELPRFEAFSWQAGLNRLMMGYTVGECDALVDGILPYADLEGSSAQPLGGLYRFIATLAQAHSEFKQAATLPQWAERLSRYSSQIFVQPGDPLAADELGMAQLQRLLDQLSTEFAAVHEGEVEQAVIERWLSDSLTERKSSNGFLRGQLTFCSMLPMRSIPFRVIVLMGMNEGDYPRMIQPHTFDLMGQQHRLGDRSARHDDRAQFLETLLCARERLLISYIGQSIQDNSEIAPSAVVSELLDLLESDYQQSAVVTRHPLQPFNRRYYAAGSDLFSYSQRGLKTARLLQGERVSSRPWWQGTVESQPEQVIEVASLFKFFKDPQGYFVERVLGIRLEQHEAEAEERERFAVDSLENYQTNQQLVERLLANAEGPEQNPLLDDGWWVGAVGELELERRVRAIAPFVETIRALDLGERSAALDIDLAVGPYRIIGQLNHTYEHGALRYRYSKMKGGDLLTGWLYHQLSNRLTPSTTTILSQERQLTLLPQLVNPDDLQRWLDIYIAGQREPSPLFVEAALAYLRQHAINSKKSPLAAAATALQGQLNSGFNPQLALLYRGVDDVNTLLSEPFQQICDELLLPMWQGVV